MKIGIDARMFGSGFGLARYVQQLILHLEQLDRENEYILFFKKDNWNAYEPACDNIRKVPADIHWYGAEEQVKFSGIIKQQRPDLMHFPHWNVPLMYGDPFVITIHDVFLLHHPDTNASTHSSLLYWIKYGAYKLVLKRAVGKARHILTTSEFTKSDIHRMLGVPFENMTVTYQAPFSAGSVAAGCSLQTYHIIKPFALYVGAAYPHKNLETLLRAWDMVCARTGAAYQLVLAGKEDFAYQRLLDSDIVKNIKERYGEHSVVHTGFVPDDDLDALYRAASVFVYPSLYEGFGLPPLEAMSRGTPVISSSASCLPEVLGEAAVYADPHDAAGMADAIRRVLEDENLRFELKEKAREELKRYSWERLARQTLEVYRRFG